MEYRRLGRSGCIVSALALGTMTFGAETDDAVAHQQLDAFLDAGGTLVDTADVYTAGAAEQILGRWLAARPSEVRDRVVLATKARFPMGVDHNDAGTSRRHLRRALDASLRRLGVEHVDLYQLHAWDPLTPLEESLRFLDDAVRAGKVGYAGLSNFTGWQVQRAVDLAEAGGLAAPVTLQPAYSLLAREIEYEVVPACQYNGLGLLPWSPLAGGWLTGKYRRDNQPAARTRFADDKDRGTERFDDLCEGTRVWDVLDVVQSVAVEHDASASQVSLAWLLGRPTVSSVILGARTLAQLQDNLGVVDVFLREQDVQALDAVSAPRPAGYPYGPAGLAQQMRSC